MHETSAIVLLVLTAVSTTNCFDAPNPQSTSTTASPPPPHDLTKRFFPAKFSDQTISQALVDGVLDRFHVNTNTIIKTGDSRALGAKYINESELVSKEDCMIWCWETNPCNLAVYEEKSRGSCYLFDCGPTEDFRCKFTQHSFYSSSVLKQNRQAYELKQWSSQSKHEDELVNLRKSATALSPSSGGVGEQSPAKSGQSDDKQLSGPGSGGLVVAPTSAGTAAANFMAQQLQTVKNNYQANARCQHYQFACRNTSDCIAVYNVCDGIPQCPDGSDEAPDLHCPDSTIWTPGQAGYRQPPPTPGTRSVPASPTARTVLPLSSAQAEARRADGPQPQQQSPPGLLNKHHPLYKYPKAPEAFPSEAASDQKNINVGEPQLPSSAFGHKYSAFVPANKVYDKIQATNYFKQQQQQQQQQFQPWNQFYGPQPEYYNSPDGRGAYNVENDYDRESSMNAANSPIFWPVPGGDSGQRVALDQRSLGMRGAPGQGGTYGNLGGRSIKDQQQGWVPGPDLPSTFRSVQQQPPGYIPGTTVIVKQTEAQPGSKGPADETPPSTRTPGSGGSEATVAAAKPPKSPSAAKVPMAEKAKLNVAYSRLAMNQLPSHAASLAVSHLRDSSSSGRDTNSAVIALTLGLCITAMLVGLVGCRMKSIRRRIARRGGRSLTHDADYLVNGMYL